jgi:hypothetical protein
VHVDALAIRLRPRTPMEAGDLGVRLCQDAARSVYRCYLPVAVPIVIVALACYEIADWLATLIVFWSKPWLDRTILFVLSRAAFGQQTTFGDVWRAQREVWWRQFLFTWTVRRLSFWRSFTQPVYQLEGLSIREAMPRVRQIRKGKTGAAFLMTQAFYSCELALELALVSLLFWFAPSGLAPDLYELLTGEIPASVAFAFALTYGMAVLVIEPFYVAAGFAMYLNRRAELEAWDIEQEFRRAFAR